MVYGKIVRGKVVAENWAPENWPPEKWSPEKFASKIVLRQKNARKFKRLFHFYQLIPLHTQKNDWRLRHDPTYVPNCRTLKESREMCCRVLGFHRLITSEHSTHTYHDAQRSPYDFLFPVLALFPSVCCRVLGFHRLITSDHSTRTPRCSTLTPRLFISVFRVCFRVLGLLSSFGIS